MIFFADTAARDRQLELVSSYIQLILKAHINTADIRPVERFVFIKMVLGHTGQIKTPVLRNDRPVYVQFLRCLSTPKMLSGARFYPPANCRKL